MGKVTSEVPVLSRRGFLAGAAAMLLAGCQSSQSKSDTTPRLSTEPVATLGDVSSPAETIGTAESSLKHLGVHERITSKNGRVEFFMGGMADDAPFSLLIDPPALDSYAEQLVKDGIIPAGDSVRLAFVWPGGENGSEYLCSLGTNRSEAVSRTHVITMHLAVNAALHMPDSFKNARGSLSDDKMLSWLQSFANRVAWHEPAHIGHCAQGMSYVKAEPLADAYEAAHVGASPFMIFKPNSFTHTLPDTLTRIAQQLLVPLPSHS